MKPAFNYIVENYINLIYYFARRWVKDTYSVDDVVSETFLQLFKKYDTFQYHSDGELKSWLLTVCRNIILDRQKKKKLISVDASVLDSIESTSDIETWLLAEIEREDVEIILKLLDALPDEEHVIVRLRIFDELTFKSIAAVLDISEAAAKMRFYRTIKQLQEKLI